MKHLIRLLVIVAAGLALAGCVQTDVSINLNMDGSGTVTETVMMAKAVTQQMKATMEEMQKQSGEENSGPIELWKEEDIRGQAANMGEGVKFVSMELIENDNFEGYKATYSFTDINNLKVNQNPGSSMPKQEGEEAAQEEGQQQEEKKPEIISFHMEKGSPSTLTITQPEKPKAKAKAEADPEAEKPAEAEVDPAQKEMMASMMKMMLEGMKISISVQVPGDVVSTNATYRDGSRITLMEMDFDKLLQDEEAWKKFSDQQPDSVEGTKDLMKNIPGIKVEQEKAVTVTFQ